MSERKKLCIITADAGGGHRMTADALRQRIAPRYPWDVEIVNLYRDLVGDLDEFRKRFGIGGEDVYNELILKRGYTALYPLFFRLCQLNIRLQERRAEGLLRDYWTKARPDLVLSVIPFLVNRTLLTTLHQVFPDVPYVTLMTDLEECRRGFWLVHPEQYFIVGTEAAEAWARELGHPADRLFRISGMVIDPSFYEPGPPDRGRERAALGLEPDRTTALVLVGGYGSRDLVTVARALDAAGVDLQAIFLCGHNRTAADALRRRTTRYPRIVIDFTRQVPYYMALADVFIGKPGPGSITEALVRKLPLVLRCGRFMLPTERPNGGWVQRHGFGITIRRYGELGPALRRLLDPPRFAECRRNVSAFEGRGVFEVPVILERILAGPGHRPGG